MSESTNDEDGPAEKHRPSSEQPYRPERIDRGAAETAALRIAGDDEQPGTVDEALAAVAAADSPPTAREVAAAMRMNHRSDASGRLSKLYDDGLVRRDTRSWDADGDGTGWAYQYWLAPNGAEKFVEEGYDERSLLTSDDPGQESLEERGATDAALSETASLVEEIEYRLDDTESSVAVLRDQMKFALRRADPNHPDSFREAVLMAAELHGEVIAAEYKELPMGRERIEVKIEPREDDE